MMGEQQLDQGSLFYRFSQRHVPADHLLRAIDRFVDLSDLRVHQWLVDERGIEPHVPVFDKSKRTDGSFSRDDFTYDHQGDVYFCPGGKMLTCKGTIVNDNQLLYRASKYD